ncbi:MAG: DUF2961 domain-containing protein [Candidatus Eisenbacteria bacterium]|nr:DUF2961 domain-containing protein [Candidatus Eisenbacteria bacterium]
MKDFIGRAFAAALLALFIGAGVAAGEEADVWAFLDADLSRLPEFSDSKSVLFSSTDRTGGNDDGFSGLYSRLRIDEKGEHVLAEMDGPGCVTRIWMTWPGRETRLRVYIDGAREPVLDAPLEALFSGRVPPFLDPFVGGAKENGGVNFSYIPIPFEKSIRITTVDGIRFYQIQAHRYPEGTAVRSFRLPYPEEDRRALTKAIEKLARLPREIDMEMPWTVERRPGDRLVEGTVEMAGRGKQAITQSCIFRSDEPGEIVELRVSYDGEGDDWRKVRLVAQWDRKPDEGTTPEGYTDFEGPVPVNVPLADLFGSAFEPVSMRSAGILSSGTTGVLRFPMPFRTARLFLLPARKGGSCRYKMLVRPLSEEEADRRMRFRAAFSDEIIREKNHPVADDVGQGCYIGTILSARGVRDASCLEGDERIVVDGDSVNALRGTGTEDYFNSGWYFARGEKSFPFHGVTFRSEEGAPRFSAFRLHLADRIDFRDSLSFDFEVGEWESGKGPIEIKNRPVYASIALAYAKALHRERVEMWGAYMAKQVAKERFLFDNKQWIDRMIVQPRYLIGVGGIGVKGFPGTDRRYRMFLDAPPHRCESGYADDFPWPPVQLNLPDHDFGEFFPGWNGRTLHPVFHGFCEKSPWESAVDFFCTIPISHWSLGVDAGYPSDAYDVSLVYTRAPELGVLRSWFGKTEILPPTSCASDLLEPVFISPPARTPLTGLGEALRLQVEPPKGDWEPYRIPIDSHARAYKESAEYKEWGEPETAGKLPLLALIHGILIRPIGGYADRWLVVGPFANVADSRFDHAYPPEEDYLLGMIRTDDVYAAADGSPIRWSTVRAAGNGYVDLRSSVGPGVHCLAYALTRVKSPRERDALVSLGSDDGVIVWANGEEVFRHQVLRGWEDDHDRFVIHLKEGWNAILVKVTQGIAGWGFSMRINDPDGELLYDPPE